VETADIVAPRRVVGVRDSKHPNGPALRFSPTAWSAFLDLVRADEAASGQA
jgi:hypothetical protein